MRVLADLGNGGTLLTDGYRHYFEEARSLTVSSVTVKKLISLGLIIRTVYGSDRYQLTDEGQKCLKDEGFTPETWPRFKPHQCQYCGKDPERISGCFNPPIVTEQSCACGSRHKVCKECGKRYEGIVGEFPNQYVKLKKCPKQ